MNSLQKCLTNITQDREQLLICIQYETIQKQTVFDAYKNFCKNLGDDVMSFKMFDFYFHQFVQGEIDMDRVGTMNPSALELADISKLEGKIRPIAMILENLSWKDRIVMRLVSRGFRDEIDKLKKNVFDSVSFYMHGYDRITVTIDEKIIEYANERRSHDRLLSRFDINYSVIRGGFQEAFHMFSKIINTPGVEIKSILHVKILSLEAAEDQKKVLTTVHAAFEESDKLIPVRSLSMMVPLESMMITILKRLEPGTLKTIVISQTGDDQTRYNKIFKMDPWKKAKNVEVRGLSCPSDAFIRFNRFDIERNIMNYRNLVSIKDAIYSSPNFEYGRLEYAHEIDKDKLRGMLASWHNLHQPETGKTFIIDYDQYGVTFKNIPLFEEVTLIVHGDRSARLKMDGKIVDYSLNVVNETGRQKTGNWKVAIDDLFTIFGQPTLEIRQLTVEFHQLGVCNKNVMESIEKRFKSIHHKISASSFTMCMETEEQLMAFLPYIEPKTLKSLEINGQENSRKWIRLSEVVKTEQWDRSQKLRTKFVDFSFENIKVFDVCEIMCKEMNEINLLHLKHTILLFYGAYCVRLHYQEAFNVEKIRGLLGAESIISESRILTIEIEPKTVKFNLSRCQ